MQMPKKPWKMPCVVFGIKLFLNRFSQNIAIDHDGIIYGKTNTSEINFLQGKFERVINHAILPPKKTEMKHATKDIKIEFPNGFQKLFSA